VTWEERSSKEDRSSYGRERLLKGRRGRHPNAIRSKENRGSSSDEGRRNAIVIVIRRDCPKGRSLRPAGNVTRNREPVDCEPTEVIAGDCRETINNRNHGGGREESLRKERGTREHGGARRGPFTRSGRGHVRREADMSTAFEGEGTTAETERERGCERRKTNAFADTEKASTTPASRVTQTERGHPAAHTTRASKDASGRGHRSRSSKERRQEG
jgi:hypothetical protein